MRIVHRWQSSGQDWVLRWNPWLGIYELMGTHGGAWQPATSSPVQALASEMHNLLNRTGTSVMRKNEVIE